LKLLKPTWSITGFASD